MTDFSKNRNPHAQHHSVNLIIRDETLEYQSKQTDLLQLSGLLKDQVGVEHTLGIHCKRSFEHSSLPAQSPRSGWRKPNGTAGLTDLSELLFPGTGSGSLHMFLVQAGRTIHHVRRYKRCQRSLAGC